RGLLVAHDGQLQLGPQLFLVLRIDSLVRAIVSRPGPQALRRDGARTFLDTVSGLSEERVLKSSGVAREDARLLRQRQLVLGVGDEPREGQCCRLIRGRGRYGQAVCDQPSSGVFAPQWLPDLDDLVGLR